MTASAPTGSARRPALTRRLRSAIPPLGQAFVGAVVWSATMGGSALFGLVWRGWQTPDAFVAVVLVFAIGGAASFPLGLYIGRLLAFGKRREVRFAAAFLSFSIMTIGVTALVFVLWYRIYYAQWHSPAFSATWIIQQIFTTVGALAQFAALGTRLFFPVGLLALFLASTWFSAKSR